MSAFGLFGPMALNSFLNSQQTDSGFDLAGFLKNPAFLGTALGAAVGIPFLGSLAGGLGGMFRKPRETFGNTVSDIQSRFPLDPSMLLSGSPAGLAMINQAAQGGALQQQQVMRNLAARGGGGVDQVRRGLIANNAGMRATAMRGRLAQQDAQTRLQHQQMQMQLLQGILAMQQQGIDPNALIGNLFQAGGMWAANRGRNRS